MSRSLRFRCIVLLVGVGLLVPVRGARAESLGAAEAEAVGGIAGGAAAITLIVVFSIRHRPSITGCLASSPEGLDLASEREGRTYLLTGDTASLKPGERVRVQGKRRGNDPTGSPHFFVEKFKKDYGPCQPASATP